MKKTLTLLLCIIISLCLVCCTGKGEQTGADTSRSTAVSDDGKETTADITQSSADGSSQSNDTNSPSDDTDSPSETTAFPDSQGPSDTAQTPSDTTGAQGGSTDTPIEDAIDGKTVATDAASKKSGMKSYTQTVTTKMTMAGKASSADSFEQYRRSSSSTSYLRKLTSDGRTSAEYYKDGYFYTEVDGGLFKGKLSQSEFEKLRSSAAGFRLNTDDYGAFNTYTAEETADGITVTMTDVNAQSFTGADDLKAEMAKQNATVSVKSATCRILVNKDGYITSEKAVIVLSVNYAGASVDFTVELDEKTSDINAVSGISFPAEKFADYTNVEDIRGVKTLTDAAYAYAELYESGASFDFNSQVSVSGGDISYTNTTQGKCEFTAGEKTTVAISASGSSNGADKALNVNSDGAQLTVSDGTESKTMAHDEQIVWTYIDSVWISCYAYGDSITSLSSSNSASGTKYAYGLSEKALQDALTLAVAVVDPALDASDAKNVTINTFKGETELDKNGSIIKTSTQADFTFEIGTAQYTASISYSAEL